MITKLKLAIVNENYDELNFILDELNLAIDNGYLKTLNKKELEELRALNLEAIDTIKHLRQNDLQKLNKIKNSLNYLKYTK